MPVQWRGSKVLLFCSVMVVTVAGCSSKSVDRRSEGGYLHSYALSPGDTIRFESESTIGMSVDMPQLPFEGPIEMKVPMTVRFEVDDFMEGEYHGALVIEDFRLEGMEGMFGMMGGMSEIQEIVGKRMPVAMKESGKSEMSMEFPGIGMGGGMTNMPGGLSNYFIPWPGTPLRPGATWSDSTSLSNDREGMKTQFRTVSDFTYLGLKAVEEGEEDSEPAHAVHGVTGMIVEGSGTSQQMGSLEFVMSGTATVEADYFFNPVDGILDISRSTMKMSMVIDMYGMMEMSMPMYMEGSFISRRIP